jgi:hypothetical protein
MGFQVVIPELGRGFDRIECAQTARLLATPGSRIAAAPVAAVVAPIGGAAPAVGLRPLSTPTATLGFLAAGTAAAFFLWARVLGTDTAGFPFDRSAAPPAVAGETVEANPSAEVGSPNAGAPGSGAPSRTDAPRGDVVVRFAGGTAASAAPAAARRAAPFGSRGGTLTRSGGGGETTQKSNRGHNGKGHTKHGDSGDNHLPGHGNSQGGQNAHSSGGSSGHGGGSGHGKGHGKRH